MMTHTLRIASAVLLLSVLAFASGTTDKTIYTLEIDPERNVIEVSAELTLEDNRLYIAEIGASQIPKRWAAFVRDLQVRISNGQRVEVVESDEGWTVSAGKGERVSIDYAIALEHEKFEWPPGIDGAAYAREWGVFSVGRAFAVMNGENRTGIDISFDLPKDWRVSGSWRSTGENSFSADNNNDLTESMFFAGDYKSFRFQRDGFELEFAIGGPGVADQETEFSNLAKGVLEYYVTLMGGVPKPPPGSRLDKVLVVINKGDTTDGEVIGNHISMIMNPSGGLMSQTISRFLFAHEFFHLWNGKSFFPESFSEEWFKEGVSNFYTIKALRNTGAISEQELFEVMNGLFYQRYRQDDAFGKRSISEVSSGDEKHAHWGMVYGGGLFEGICRDVAIRKKSRGEQSLDDVIKGLFSDFGGSGSGYSRNDLTSRIEKLAPGSVEDLRERVYGAGTVPIDACLRDAGLDASISDGNLVIKRKADTPVGEEVLFDEMFGGRD
ncbi:MAG: hypothetical protein DWQ47_09365 [Acidobacteria bacterium]|nr:MAG: hypothetical protein DWQ32_17465 [Acidobacteriota bacterium]REJ98890.1 MAG: hypothetical protein DWQ38_12510 [Acidobacteriota bacterium]REK16390.1 MAG: hypothetical protein DWQ43_05175 [Acidobacteriota bacterium]REK44071.1 MAG: hypothetical protein DWQ47_09365 [Acidobacteriota bacterium]